VPDCCNLEPITPSQCIAPGWQMVKADHEQAGGDYDSYSMNFPELSPLCAPQSSTFVRGASQSFTAYS
jgi:hypothetical protein